MTFLLQYHPHVWHPTVPISDFIPKLCRCFFLAPGSQTKMAGPELPELNGCFFAGKIIDLNVGFSSKPFLIARGYQRVIDLDVGF